MGSLATYLECRDAGTCVDLGCRPLPEKGPNKPRKDVYYGRLPRTRYARCDMAQLFVLRLPLYRVSDRTHDV